MDSNLLFIWLFFIAQIVIALVYCFWGYKYFRVIMSLYVFIFVFPLIFSALSNLDSLNSTAALLISIGISIGAALLTWSIYKLAIFLCGGLLGIFLTFWLYASLGKEYLGLCVILGVVLFILLGSLALKFQKVLVIFISSLTGALNLVTYFLFIFMNFSMISKFDILNMNGITNTVKSSFISEPLWVIPTVILTIAGIIVQFRITAPKGKI